MDESVALHPVEENLESAPAPENNVDAHVASKLGIIGLVLVAGAIALGVRAIILALTIPDFMPDDAGDDPYALTCLACVVPFLVGCFGVIYGIAALRRVAANGERKVAIRGLVFGILTVLLPIALAVTFVNFDAASAACGGG